MQFGVSQHFFPMEDKDVFVINALYLERKHQSHVSFLPKLIHRECMPGRSVIHNIVDRCHGIAKSGTFYNY